MKVGYIRVSTEEQNTARQEVMMEELGVEKIFMEKITAKTQCGREQLEAMLQFVRRGMRSWWNPSPALPGIPGICWRSWNGWRKKG